MAMFLSRAFDYSDNGGGDLFGDDDGKVYEHAADQLKTAGVTIGCNPPANDRFCGEGVVSREQMAAFLVRALGLTDDGGSDLYLDDDDSRFESAKDRLGTAGITQGCNPPVNDRFCPELIVTRGQMAAFLTRALDLEGFGARAVGPGLEARTSVGRVVGGSGFAGVVESASPGQVILLSGGSYSGGFHIPAGVTLKPFNGETVVINGSVTMGSGSVLAGVDLRSSSQWAIRVDAPSQAKSDVVIRNSVIRGGSVETIRVAGNVTGTLIAGNDIFGGGNHVIKVHGEGSGFSPSATIRGNRIHDPVREDAIQTEDNGGVTIDGNTFWGTPENAIDVKTGEVVVITNNLFEGATIHAEALLVHGNGTAVVVHNSFSQGAAIGLGSSTIGDPMMTLRGSRLDGGDLVIRRSTRPIVIEGNVLTGGTLKLGISGGDHPRDATVVGNLFRGTELLDRVTPAGDTWTCNRNTLVDVIGDWSRCS